MNDELRPCLGCGSQTGRVTKKSAALSPPIRSGAHYGYWYPKEWDNLIQSESKEMKS